MKNILKVLFVLILVLAMTVSCSPDTGREPDNSDQGQGDSNQGQDEPDDTDEEGGWPGVFVAYYRGNADISTQNLEKRFSNETNVELSLQGGEESDNLFIVGEYDNELSKHAYWKMDRVFSFNENNTIN